jgi:hypothetical protein
MRDSVLFGILLLLFFSVSGYLYFIEGYQQQRFDSLMLNKLSNEGFAVNYNGIIKSPPLVLRDYTLSQFMSDAHHMGDSIIYFYSPVPNPGHNEYYAFAPDFHMAYMFETQVGPLADWEGAWS